MEFFLEFFVYLFRQDQGADLAADEFFGLFCKFAEVGFVYLSDEDKVDEAGVDATCVVAGDGGAGNRGVRRQRQERQDRGRDKRSGGR